MQRVWILAIAVLAAGLLSACDDPSLPNEPLAYDALPDPSVDWEPLVEVALEGADCATLFQLMNALTHSNDTRIVPYIDRALALDRCTNAPTFYRQHFSNWPNSFQPKPEESIITYERIRNEVGVPGYRGADLYLYERHGIELPIDLLNLERHWIVRCEGPLKLWVGRPYELRRDLARLYEDEGYLIPEWEVRQAECVQHGITLTEAFGKLLENQSSNEVRRIVASNLGDLNRDIEQLQR